MEIAQTENLKDRALSALSGTFPCGIMGCTVGKYPQVLYANQWIFDLLGVSEEGEYWQDYLKDNVFFMIPSDQWPEFRRCLQQAQTEDASVSLAHRIKPGQGQEVEVMGWVRCVTGDRGQREFQFLYIRLPEERNAHWHHREQAWMGLLAHVYDGVFRIERQHHIVECLSIQETLNTRMYFMPGMRVVLDCLLQKSYYMLVYTDDRHRVADFFKKAVEQTGFSQNGPCRINFRTLGEGILKEYVLTAAELDDQTVLLCCREVTEERSAQRKAQELKQVRSINARIVDSGDRPQFRISAYRILENTVFSQSEDTSYLPAQGVELDTFLEQEHISRESYDRALSQGEAALDKLDRETRYLYMAQRSQRAGEDPDQLMLIYRFPDPETQEKQDGPRVTIRTFGYFDVLVDGKPIVFPHEKSKEMLALMVDRKGSFIGNPYFISCLWEDEPYGEKIQSRCRQTAFRMMETLKRYGIENIIEKVDGHRRIIPEMVSCDYFDYINGKNSGKNGFNGTYMTDYSWGEETLSTLLRSSDPEKNQ